MLVRLPPAFLVLLALLFGSGVFLLLHDLRLRIGMYGSGFANTAALAAVLAKRVGGVDRPRRA
ncbi:hypothetical protein [Saccharothrix longispora]|uniref:hypothetical protein n=1 Tax=Saccharothrix longispora TaxID=33920 RepID=UPI0028FD9C39|nr:hypothetical protein [Saccharothrix longispora]MDU0290908.1 hypothetical protein [Saccharothrix longispora]